VTGQIFRSICFSANITKTRFAIRKKSDNLEICSTARPRPLIQNRAETGEVCALNVSRENSGSCICRGVDFQTVRGWNAGTVTKGGVGIRGVGGGEVKLGSTWVDYRLVFNVAHTLATNKRRIIKSIPVRPKLWRSEDIMWQECGRGLGFHSRLESL
jgi:hypothetical protein